MVLITFTERIADDNFIYQHDNAPIYTSKRTKRWLHQKECQGFNMTSLFPRLEFHRKSLGANCKKISCIAGNIIPLENYPNVDVYR